MLISRDKELNILGINALKHASSEMSEDSKIILYLHSNNEALSKEATRMFLKRKRTMRNFELLISYCSKYTPTLGLTEVKKIEDSVGV